MGDTGREGTSLLRTYRGKTAARIRTASPRGSSRGTEQRLCWILLLCVHFIFLAVRVSVNLLGVRRKHSSVSLTDSGHGLSEPPAPVNFNPQRCAASAHSELFSPPRGGGKPPKRRVTLHQLIPQAAAHPWYRPPLLPEFIPPPPCE